MYTRLGGVSCLVLDRPHQPALPAIPLATFHNYFFFIYSGETYFGFCFFAQYGYGSGKRSKTEHRSIHTGHVSHLHGAFGLRYIFRLLFIYATLIRAHTLDIHI